MQVTALGDSALIVRVRDRFDDAPDDTLSEVLAALRRLENAQIPGVIELAPDTPSRARRFCWTASISRRARPGPASGSRRSTRRN